MSNWPCNTIRTYKKTPLAVMTVGGVIYCWISCNEPAPLLPDFRKYNTFRPKSTMAPRANWEKAATKHDARRSADATR